MMKKVLLVSYYWPPAGGVSVLRTLKIAKYLRQFGWEPVVLTTQNGDYPYLDDKNLEDVPQNMEVLKVKIIEPFKLFKLFTNRKPKDRLDNILQVSARKSHPLEKLGIWVRANFFIPDARSLWIRPAVKFLKTYLAKNPVDAIFSDGPPHTNTVIAQKISTFFDIPWLADFQDPWTQADYYQLFPITKPAHRIHRKMEQAVFDTAHQLTIASPTWKKDLEAIGASNVEVVYYGYDEEDFDGIKAKSSSKFVIAHTGLFGVDRCPDAFFEVLGELSAKHKIEKQNLEIKLAGEVDPIVKESLKKSDLLDMTEFLGFIPRRSVLELICNADLLLLPLNKATNAKGRLPGKLYEYLRAQRPILSFGPVDSDAASILSDSDAGVCLDYADKDGMRQHFLAFYENRNGISDIKMEHIAQYSNDNQTRKVAMLLDSIVLKNAAEK